MRVLVISDIHANLYALDACMEAFPAYDVVWNLGDVVGYGANPNEVIARVCELGKIFVRGNHDKACSGVSDLTGFNPVAALAAIWTKQTLSPANLEWLKVLPQGPIKPNEEVNVACVHGSPVDEDQYVINVHDALEPLTHPIAGHTFFGHTHLQGGFCKNGGEIHALRPAFRDPKHPQRIEFKLEDGVQYMINPGSIGQPRDGDPRAGFALYDTDEELVIFYRVPYDIHAAQRDIRQAGLPPRLAERLVDGR
ncbi:MAG: metallophosphoesterase family protein [Acidobacteria bacterium]|nr:metallophosphoesterase family protein [Acidobacteriota bacterium]